MTCLKTVDGKQTEFEFYRQMVDSPNAQTCCGPNISIGFSRPLISLWKDLLEITGRSLKYLDSFQPLVLDSNHIALTMCARHWLQYSSIFQEAGQELNRDSWIDLAHYLFHITCLMASWDSKELTNYLGN